MNEPQYISISHWGMFLIPEPKPERFKKVFLYPTVDMKDEYRKYFLDIRA